MSIVISLDRVSFIRVISLYNPEDQEVVQINIWNLKLFLLTYMKVSLAYGI